MKITSKTIAVFALLSLAATSPVLAEPKEEIIKSPAQTEEDDQQEFYDYHSGITYSYSVFDYIFPHANKASIEQEKKGQ